MKHRNIMLVLLALLLVSTVAADSFSVRFTKDKTEIFRDEAAKYELNVNNLINQSQSFSIYSLDPAWSVETKPTISSLDPLEERNVSLKLIPNAWAPEGAQKIRIGIESHITRDKAQAELEVYLRSWDPIRRDYVPSVEMVTTIPDKIDPRERIPIGISLRNRNRLNMSGLNILVRSSLFQDEIKLDLGPLKEVSQEVWFDIDPLTSPQEDTIEVAIIYDQSTINQIKQPYEVASYSDIVTERDIKKEFFREVEDVTIRNVGNYENGKIFSHDVTWLQKFFTTATPEPLIKEKDGEYSLIWDRNLLPLEEYSIQIKTNYRSLIYLFFASVTLAVIYFISRSPVVAKKDILIIGSPHEGIKEMKIMLHIRNRSRDIVEHISFTDLVPTIAEIIDDSYIGTLAPTKVLHNDRKGSLIKWEIKTLEPFEERIISYRIKSKLNLIGGVKLPQTKVKFETRKGRERVIRSNAVEIKLS